MTLDALNRASDAEFLAQIGGPLEGQTWLARRVAPQRPFADVNALMAAFEHAVESATEDERIALIASHPDLAGKLSVERPLSADSVREQSAAGLDRLTPDEYAEFQWLNTEYKARHGFPFVICARENTKDSILAAFYARLGNPRTQEIETAVREVLKILRLRLIDKYAKVTAMDYKISYGKAGIALYRSFSGHLTGLTPIPESPFTGQQHGLFALELEFEIFGGAFLPAYTEGDNSNVIATATMTNFALQKALTYPGATLEGFLHYLGGEFLAQYPQMEAVRLTAKELPFPAALITDDGGRTLTPSDRLFAAQPGSYGFASMDVARDGSGVKVTAHECGRHDIKLFKLTGNAFANFQRDAFTTLPEKTDRPLYIYLDMGWRYADVADALSENHARYIASPQVYDHLQHTFHDFVNMSIQHLIHEMGVRLLDRFPQMSEVWFKAQNRLWDNAAEGEDGARVFMDPRPPYGALNLHITR